MEAIDIQDIQSRLAEWLVRVEEGEEVVIGRNGAPVAKLVPFSANRTPRKLGIWKGKARIAEDFDELPDDIAESFGMRE